MCCCASQARAIVNDIFSVTSMQLCVTFVATMVYLYGISRRISIAPPGSPPWTPRCMLTRMPLPSSCTTVSSIAGIGTRA
ncbi:Uncharacterised protein [Bordetella pertussis]|nr:Uncharacterised protein [Bordetella pertussis]